MVWLDLIDFQLRMFYIEQLLIRLDLEMIVRDDREEECSIEELLFQWINSISNYSHTVDQL